MVTNNRQTLYDSGILRQEYRNVRDFIGHHQSAKIERLRYPSSRLRNHTSRLRNNTRFADWVVQRPERIETGLITASGQTVRAVHSGIAAVACYIQY